MPFQIKEVNESLYCVTLGATQEFLVQAILSKLHKLHCREQERVCLQRDPVYILTFQHQFLIYSFVLLFFSSSLWLVVVTIIKSTWLKVPGMPK